jgi:hypothetical protein
MDAEAFEMLSHSISVSPSYLVPGEESTVELPSLDDLGQLPTRIDSIEAEESGVAVIDHFPFGSAGASIPSSHEDATWNGQVSYPLKTPSGHHFAPNVTGSLHIGQRYMA